MHAQGPARTGREQHVALAQKLLGTLLVEDGAAVDLGRHLEADAGREVGLDGAGDDVDRWPLRRHDQVDAGRSRHLRQPLHRALDLFAGDDHQIGELIDHDRRCKASARARCPFL